MNDQTDKAATLWKNNLDALNRRFPMLGKLLAQPGLREQVCTLRAKDGSIAYGICKDSKIIPITNPVDPLAKINAQLAQWNDKLQDFTRPVLILGVHPGLEVLHLFNLRKQAAGSPCDQPIWLCIDSIPAFCGFLKTYDATALLNAPRVELFAKEEIPARVAWLRDNPQFPYLFSMISLSPPKLQQAVLAPLAKLIQERSKQIQTLQKENDAFYDTVTDEELAQTLSGKGGRKPRLLAPTCPWSTVIQYSIRDTVTAFEAAGWDVQVLNSPAMLTPHYTIKSIHEFKPDLFLYVNHLRTEVTGVIPDNLFMISWIQDPLPSVNNKEAAEKWNRMTVQRKRDLIIGYTEQLKPYGYRSSRLQPQNMQINTRIFRPRKLSAKQRSNYECDVCFTSNNGLPVETIVRRRIAPSLAEEGFSETMLMELSEILQAHYRAGKTCTTYSRLIDTLKSHTDFFARWSALEWARRERVSELLFWRLNDSLYRYTVLEWLADRDIQLHLYGTDWAANPQFAPYAKGHIKHGKELSLAYQTARLSLHLNAMEREHQRPLEIIAAGGTLLTRCSNPANRRTEACRAALRKLYTGSDDLTEPEYADVADCMLRKLSKNPNLSFDEFFDGFDWTADASQYIEFTTQEDLYKLL